jgi:four helix bundle protein
MEGVVVNSYRDLRVWQHAMELAVACYEITKAFPPDERYGLIAQIRRSAASVSANIAEGYGRDSTGSYIHFLKTARGSLKELETHLILSERVKVLPGQDFVPLLRQTEDIGKMLNSLIRSLESRTRKHAPD